MSRILLLVLFCIWMVDPSDRPTRAGWEDVALFFGFYLMLVVMLGMWARLLARRVATHGFRRSVRIFNYVMFGARVMVPTWFAIGVWMLGWSDALFRLLGDNVYRSVAGMLLGTMPAFATWMGLWWSQYPAERALREQNLLVELDNDLPLYQPPDFWSYFVSNFRMQILFTLAPVAMIVLVRDVIVWGAMLAMGQPIAAEPQALEFVASVVSAGGVFLFAPALLARVLKTSPMPDSDLRDKLDGMCRRAGIRYRDILVWHTNNHVGNAAVMGVLPGLRYVLLSDVLLERMSDSEIEAVFAHELGHVVHRHMIWYAIFMIGALLAAFVVAGAIKPLQAQVYGSVLAMISPAGIAGIVLLFGALSRRCERQADVYAARTMEMLNGVEPVVSETQLAPRQLATLNAGPALELRQARQTSVGEHGARQFAMALRRVAMINNIPVNRHGSAEPGVWNHLTHYTDVVFELANNYLHGSIASRMTYVEHLADDPQRTSQFDRKMFWLYCTLVFTLVISAALSAAILLGPQ